MKVFASMKKIISGLAFVLFLLLFAGCQTDYSERAADEARAYALKKLKGLNEDQRHFICYTSPVLYSNLIFPQSVLPLSPVDHVKLSRPHLYPTAPQQDIMHHCFVWDPPGLDSKVVVVGEGERSLRFWWPIRVILKNYVPGTPNYNKAHKEAISYAQNKMLYLSQNELNRIRYSEPDVVYTRFQIMVKLPDEIVTSDPRDPDGLLIRKKVERPVLTQISLVWPADKKDELIVVTGVSTTGTLYLWQVNSAQYTTTDELVKKTLSQKEINSIKKDVGPDEGKLIFPPEQEIDRGKRGKESGSIFGGDLKF